jgi:hypothetical protein
MGVLLLNGCAEPSFSFRGYTELSDCRSVINAEIDGGARFVDAIDAELQLEEGVVTRLAGTLLEYPVDIYVSCYNSGRVSAVDYITDVSEPEASAATFSALALALESAYGAPTERGTANSRTRIYRCASPISLVLREARLGNLDFEVSLLVVPDPTDC